MEHGRNDELLIGLPAEPAAVRTARRCAQYVCRQWAVPARVGDAVSLIVSELTTNVVRHVGGAFRLLIRRESGAICVEVEDLLDCPPPQVVAADANSERGRGLLLVERVARRWGCEPIPQGKRMWALVAS